MLHPDLFATLDILWGPHTIDRLSCPPNPKTDTLYASSVAQSGENNWRFPPSCLVPNVLRHLEFSKADTDLIVPHWESVQWWPLLIQQKNIFKTFIAEHPVWFNNAGVQCVSANMLFL